MNRKFPVLIFTLAVSLLILYNCSEEPTKSLYDPNYKPDQPNPVIESVEPAGGTFSGIGEVTINGQNFSSNSATVHVYFDGIKADLISTSETEIKAVAPVVAGDSVVIKVRIDGAILFGEFSPYKLEVAVREYGGVNYVSDAYGVACDQFENLYVSLGEGRIIKITPEEEQEDYVADAGGFYGALKMGPGGKLYGIRTRFLYESPVGGGSIDRATGRLLKRPIDFDFDQHDNIFYAATEGIYLIRQDFTDTLAIEYPDINLSTIRIYNDYVYVGGVYTGAGTPDVRIGVWRNQILSANGQLGATENVFNMEEYYNATAGVPEIRTITFAEDGDLYIGVDSTSVSEAITVVRPSAGDEYLPDNAEALFEVLLIPPATVFCWGMDQYLYVNRRSNSDPEKVLLRLTMGKNTAPYYGRQ
jgi:hypothetical protein